MPMMPLTITNANEDKFNLSSSHVQYRYSKYVVEDNAQLKETLMEYGVAIIPNVLETTEITAMNAGMWDTLETMTAHFTGVRDNKAKTPILPISRNDPETWQHLREFTPLHKFLLQHHSIGHARYVWDVRGNERIHQIFAAIHNTDPKNLISSFDGVGIYLPKPDSTTKKTKENLWLHTDQRFDYSREPLDFSVQSWVTGYDVPDGSATLAFLEGSHKHHAEFGALSNTTKTHKDNWYRLEKASEYDFFMKTKGCKLRAIKCPAGSMVLWDSRTMHCGIVGTKVQNVPRNIVYVCLADGRRVPQKTIQKRRKAFSDKRLTTHSPKIGKLFPDKPRTYGKPQQRIVMPPTYTEKDLPQHMKSLLHLP